MAPSLIYHLKYKIATNVYYSDGTMDDGNENSTMRNLMLKLVMAGIVADVMASAYNTAKETRIPLNGFKTWVLRENGIGIRTIADSIKRNRDDIESYCEVRSNFVNGTTNGYTRVLKYVTERGRIARTIIKEGKHIMGKEVGRISTKTTYFNIGRHHTNNTVEMKYEEFNDDHQIEYNVGDNEIGFYQNDIKRISYSNTKTSEQLYFSSGEVVYLISNTTSDYSTIDRYDYAKSKHVRRIMNDTGLVVINGKRYLLDGTINLDTYIFGT